MHAAKSVEDASVLQVDWRKGTAFFRSSLAMIVVFAVAWGFFAASLIGSVSVNCTPAGSVGGGPCTLEVWEPLQTTRVSYDAGHVQLTLKRRHADDDDNGGVVELRGLATGPMQVSIYRDVPAVERWDREHAALREGSLRAPLQIRYGNVSFILSILGPVFLLVSAGFFWWSLGTHGADLYATFDARQGTLRLRYQRPLRKPLVVTHPLSSVSVRVEKGDDETRPTLHIMVPQKGWTLLAVGPRPKLEALAQRIRELVILTRLSAPQAPAARRNPAAS